ALPPVIARAGTEPMDGARLGGPGSGAVDRPADLTLDEVERHHILQTLDRHRWNKKRVAGILGIDTKTLYNKLRRYGVPISTRGDGDATIPSSYPGPRRSARARDPQGRRRRPPKRGASGSSSAMTTRGCATRSSRYWRARHSTWILP